MNELDRAYELGISAGLKRASKEVMDAAVVSFSSGNDMRAKMLRALAKGLEEQAKDAHPGVPEELRDI